MPDFFYQRRSVLLLNRPPDRGSRFSSSRSWTRSRRRRAGTRNESSELGRRTETGAAEVLRTPNNSSIFADSSSNDPARAPPRAQVVALQNLRLRHARPGARIKDFIEQPEHYSGCILVCAPFSPRCIVRHTHACLSPPPYRLTHTPDSCSRSSPRRGRAGENEIFESGGEAGLHRLLLLELRTRLSQHFAPRPRGDKQG